MNQYNRLLSSDDGEFTTINGYNARHYTNPGASFSVARVMAERNAVEGTRSVYIRTQSGNTYYLDMLRGVIVSLNASLESGRLITRPLRRIVADITCGEGFAYEAVEIDKRGRPVGLVRAHTSSVTEIVTLEDGPGAVIGLGLGDEREVPFVHEFDEARDRLQPDHNQWV